jgi:putative oxidoreductase
MNTTTNDSSIRSQPSTGKRLNVGLWTAQILLAAMFGMAGFMKVSQPIDHLSAMVPFAAQFPSLVRFIGVAELAGALGLILPAATRVLPMLTPLAATGLVVVMVLASCFHVSRGEISHLPITIILGSLAAFVAWGRFAKARISKSQ